MSLLSDKQLKEYARTHNFIQPFMPRKVERGDNMHSGEICLSSFGLEPTGYTFRAEQDYIVHPKKGLKIRSYEKLYMPVTVAGMFQGKSSFTRNGLIFATAPIEPGFIGHLEFYVFNTHEFKTHNIYAKQGIAQAWFFEVQRPDSTYQGQYQEK